MRRLAGLAAFTALLALLPFGNVQAVTNCPEIVWSNAASVRCANSAGGNIAFQVKLWCRNWAGAVQTKYGPVRTNNESSTGAASGASKAYCSAGYSWIDSQGIWWFR